MTRELLLEHICPTDCTDDCILLGCDYCNVQLNELLDKYDNHVIEQYKANTRLNDTIREIHDNVANEMYCKAIDDFVKASRDVVYDYYTEQAYIKYDDFCKIAKQLKEQK